MTNEDLQQIQTLVSGARTVLILTHKDPSLDTMASALSLHLALSKMGKNVTVAMESEPLVEVSNLVGIDQVKTTLGGGKDLLVTYKPYNLGDFEKVSYLEDQNSQGSIDSFKLTITPREGFVPDPKNFHFSTSGVSGPADLLFTVEVLEPSQVGALYDTQLFSSTPIINIDNHDPNRDYGRFNLVEPDAASISEITTFFLRAISAQIDQDIAANLYQGIVSATNNFQAPRVAAATFEAAAICLRAGAKGKKAPAPQQGVSQGTVPPFQGPTPQPTQQHFQGQQGKGAFPGGPQPSQPRGQQPGQTSGNQNVPEDWTQPKAFRGTSVI